MTKIEGEFAIPNFLHWATTSTTPITIPGINIPSDHVERHLVVSPRLLIGPSFDKVLFKYTGNGIDVDVCLLVNEEEVHIPEKDVLNFASGNVTKAWILTIYELQRHPQKYLGNNGTITIRVVLRNVTRTSSGPVEEKCELAVDLNRARLSQDYCDVTLVCGSESISCHKFILAARSQVFDAMFRHKDFKESVEGSVKIEDATPEAIKSLVKYFYTNKVDDAEITTDLLIAAHKYDAVSLGRRCVEFLRKNLSKDNAVEIFTIAYLHNAEELKQTSISFIVNNFKAIEEKNDLERFAQSHPRAIMEIMEKMASTKRT